MSIDLKARLKEGMKAIFAEPTFNEKTIQKYISPNYIQYVNGETLNYQDFIQHIKAQKKLVESVEVTFKECLVDGNKVCTIHIIDAIKKDGSSMQGQVNAVFTFENDKVICCDELTHVLQGLPEDNELGSVR